MSNAVTSFSEWCNAVDRNYSQLYPVRDYLNEKGIERLNVFASLSEWKVFASSANEMLSLIEDETDLLHLSEANLPISCIYKLALSETKERNNHV